MGQASLLPKKGSQTARKLSPYRQDPPNGAYRRSKGLGRLVKKSEIRRTRGSQVMKCDQVIVVDREYQTSGVSRYTVLYYSLLVGSLA